MRKRPSPEGSRPRRGARSWAPAALAFAGLGLVATAYLHAQAEKGLNTDRVDRVRQTQVEQQAAQKADTEVWSTAKIIINLDARCPVVTTLGYFGAFALADADPAKAAELQSRYVQLQKTASPIAEEIKKMAAANTFVGRKFPSALVPRLNVMCGDLYGVVAKLYGDDSLAELKRYVTAQTQGAYVQD